MLFSKLLIYWYLQNKRELPWRKSKNPYYVWLSEVILQQTRVAQGLPYFLKFIGTFPTVFHLAEAKENEVLKLWQGLGYYSRARNLHFSAKYVVKELHGKFPNNYKELLLLKGIGAYTASAIASFCFNEPTAVVDGNVYRVLSRYFGIKTPINSSAGIKEFKTLAQNLIDTEQPGTYNQAIMDFGALHCKPKNPLCNTCPFSDTCLAFEKKLINELPVKENKIQIKKRYFNYLVVLTDDKKTVLNQRKEKDIWQGLYEFPLIETTKSITYKELLFLKEFQELFPAATTISLFNKKEIIHKLSHQHLYTYFWKVKISKINVETISWEEVKKYPIPVLISKFLYKYLSIK